MIALLRHGYPCRPLPAAVVMAWSAMAIGAALPAPHSSARFVDPAGAARLDGLAGHCAPELNPDHRIAAGAQAAIASLSIGTPGGRRPDRTRESQAIGTAKDHAGSDPPRRCATAAKDEVDPLAVDAATLFGTAASASVNQARRAVSFRRARCAHNGFRGRTAGAERTWRRAASGR
jgi:hypothetical protein